MLDAVAVYILNLILKLCPVGGGYGVLETADVIVNSPTSYKLTEQKISDAVKLLSGLGYVNLRYYGSDGFCLIPTQKARTYQEEIKRERLHDFKINSSSFGWSFFGAFMGAIVAVVVALVIKYAF